MPQEIDAGLVRTPRARPRVRLFCFAHAGGTTTNYKDWGKLLPEWIEPCAVELPGRGVRLSDAPVPEMTKLVDDLLPRLTPFFDMPYAIFGHSVGAKIAFEIARRAVEEGSRRVTHLFLAASAAPHVTRRRRVHDLSHHEFIEELHLHGGTPKEVLADRELMDMFLPALRADFALSELYAIAPSVTVSSPITGLAALRDPVVTVEDVAQWQRYTRSGFRVAQIEGDHFIVTREKTRVVAEIVRDLEPSLGL